MKHDAPDELTADQAKVELGVTTREAVVAMIHRGELPGSRKLEPNKPTSPWLIPVEALAALKRKRAKPAKA